MVPSKKGAEIIFGDRTLASLWEVNMAGTRFTPIKELFRTIGLLPPSRGADKKQKEETEYITKFIYMELKDHPKITAFDLKNKWDELIFKLCYPHLEFVLDEAEIKPALKELEPLTRSLRTFWKLTDQVKKQM